MKFVDTNVIVRFVARDNAPMLSKARAFFERLDLGEESATTSDAILAEVVFVLGSNDLYKLTRAEIRDRLIGVLAFRGWSLPDRAIWIRALDLFASRTQLSFPDALAAAYVLGRSLDSVISFDRDFDKIPGVKREEP